MTTISLQQKIFQIQSEQEFNELSLRIFRYQYQNNSVYRQFVDGVGYHPERADHYSQIPFMPIELFKTHKIISSNHSRYDKMFTSSGTTGSQLSKHYVVDIELYRKSFMTGFEFFYGPAGEYILIALLPSYLEKANSSLIFMADSLIKATGHPESGFYLEHNKEMLKVIESKQKKVILLGVSFALLDLAEKYPLNIPETIIMETGGMKGRRRELIREELHRVLCSAFHVFSIHSEYGMTELLSQAYSLGDGIFRSPPWMKVLVRDPNDPLSILGNDKTGGLNIIDLANYFSCSFVATEDLGKTNKDGSFKVLGRYDTSDIRGCNLMVS